MPNYWRGGFEFFPKKKNKDDKAICKTVGDAQPYTLVN
jgi:hypothetical protein